MTLFLSILPSIFALLLVIATFMYFLQTKKLVEENKKFRNEQYRPRVTVGYELHRMYRNRPKNFVYFVVRNIGLTSAFNISFNIKSDLEYNKEMFISQIPLVEDTIQYLAPNEDKKWYLFVIDRPDEKISFEKRYKDICKGTLTYYDSSELKNIHKEDFIIKFIPLKGYIYEE